MIADPARRPLRPQPTTNQNLAGSTPPAGHALTSRIYRASRLVARIALFPLCAVVATGSLAVNVVFIKSLLGF